LQIAAARGDESSRKLRRSVEQGGAVGLAPIKSIQEMESI
jgi:hypothetical protein